MKALLLVALVLVVGGIIPSAAEAAPTGTIPCADVDPDDPENSQVTMGECDDNSAPAQP